MRGGGKRKKVIHRFIHTLKFVYENFSDIVSMPLAGVSEAGEKGLDYVRSFFYHVVVGALIDNPASSFIEKNRSSFLRLFSICG